MPPSSPSTGGSASAISCSSSRPCACAGETRARRRPRMARLRPRALGAARGGMTVAIPLGRARATPTAGAPETSAVRAMFDRIAPRYDLLNHLLSAGIDVRWRRAAVAALAAPPGARVLDLCTGTADLLIQALRGDAGGQGCGLDFSGEMLARAAGKLARAGLSRRAGLVAGDVQSLPVRDGAFDGVLVAFG